MSEVKHKEDRFAVSEDMLGMETTKVRTMRENYDFLGEYHFWTYFSVAAIFALVSYMVIQNNMTFVNSLPKPKFSISLSVLYILFIIGFIILAYAGFMGNCYSPNEMRKGGSNVFFVLYLFIFLTWVYTLFGKKDLKNAFFISIALFLITLLWIFWLWKTDRTAAYLMIYVLIITGFITWMSYLFTKTPLLNLL